MYTENDYYNLPEDVRAELIDGSSITYQHPAGYTKKYRPNYSLPYGNISNRKTAPAKPMPHHSPSGHLRMIQQSWLNLAST